MSAHVRCRFIGEVNMSDAVSSCDGPRMPHRTGQHPEEGQHMSTRRYIDSFAMVGRFGRKDVEAEYSTEALLEEMEWCGIHAALVSHGAQKVYDPAYANRMLLAELKKSPRLYGVWSVMPHHTGEMPPPKDVVAEMRDNGICAAKMYPRFQHYFFDEFTCGELLHELENNRILLLLEGGNMYAPDILEPSNEVLLSELDRMLELHPELPVLLQGARWDATRYLITLMMKHNNLHLEFSAHQGNRAIEDFSARFGPERFCFGTGALSKSPGAAKSFIDYSTISDEEKTMIAGGNLARLLKLRALPSEYKTSRSHDPILDCAKEGKPLKETLVIDAHAHISHNGGTGVGFMYQPASDAAGMKQRAKTMGIGKVCISAWIGLCADYDEGNEIVHDAMQQFPRFYCGYATLQPQYVKDWPCELKKVYEGYGFKGLKPYHPHTGLAYNDPLWDPWYEYGNRMNAFALMHPSPNFASEIDDLAARYPKIMFILAHSGGSYKDARIAIEAALKHPNIALEITLTAVTYKIVEFMVKHVGADRVLFGTDQPMRDPIPQFGWVTYSHCTAEEKTKILGLNMQKIIRRVKSM
jgi:predicted TIM-barrel fold metal-dependent hydrolase